MTASPLTERTVFVAGAQRSGTTWLQLMLATHPDVLTIPPETNLFGWGMSVLRDQTQGDVVIATATGTWYVPPGEFAVAARNFCDAAFGSYVDRVRPDAPRVLERSPGHVWHLGLIASIYPEAQPGSGPQRSAARAAAPGVPRCLEVRDEDLLARPGQITDVLAFLGPEAGQEAERQGPRGVADRSLPVRRRGPAHRRPAALGGRRRRPRRDCRAVDCGDLAVRVVTPTTASRAKGTDAAAALLEQLAAEGPRGDPRAGEQEFHGGSWTVVLEHQAASGPTTPRLVVVAFGPDLAVRRIRYHGFPDPAAPAGAAPWGCRP